MENDTTLTNIVGRSLTVRSNQGQKRLITFMKADRIPTDFNLAALVSCEESIPLLDDQNWFITVLNSECPILFQKDWPPMKEGDHYELSVLVIAPPRPFWASPR